MRGRGRGSEGRRPFPGCASALPDVVVAADAVESGRCRGSSRAERGRPAREKEREVTAISAVVAGLAYFGARVFPAEVGV